jgi:hypothetical protein
MERESPKIKSLEGERLHDKKMDMQMVPEIQKAA